MKTLDRGGLQARPFFFLAVVFLNLHFGFFLGARLQPCRKRRKIRVGFSPCGQKLREWQEVSGRDFTSCGKTHSGGRPGIYPPPNMRRINAGFGPRGTAIVPSPASCCSVPQGVAECARKVKARDGLRRCTCAPSPFHLRERMKTLTGPVCEFRWRSDWRRGE